jgi:hypothetical protein
MAKSEVNENDQLRAEMAEMKATLNRLQSANSSTPFQRYSEAPTGIQNEDRIAAFLKAEDRPYVLYSEDRCFQITLKYGGRIVDTGTHQVQSMPDLILKFTPYFGAGSEIPNPTDPKSRKYRWGTINLETYSEVVAGRVTLSDLLALITDSQAWREVRIFDDVEAKARIRADYEIAKAKAAEEARAEKIRSSRPVGSQKGGGMALAPSSII